MRNNHRVLAGAAPRKGITLVEVVISLVMLSVGVLAMGAFVVQFTRSVRNAGVEMVGHQLAAERLEQVKSTQRYALIDTLYAGKVETIPNGPSAFTRKTKVTHIGGTAAGNTEDYRVITVEVTSPRLKKPIAKTTIVSVF